MPGRSEEHTSELQSHSEISYAVFCLKKKKTRDTASAAPCRWTQTRSGREVRARVAPRCPPPRPRPGLLSFFFFFFNDTATTEIYTNLNTLSIHDALPISSRRRHTRFLNVTGVQTCALPIDRKSTRLNSSHIQKSRMPSSA